MSNLIKGLNVQGVDYKIDYESLENKPFGVQIGDSVSILDATSVQRRSAMSALAVELSLTGTFSGNASRITVVFDGNTYSYDHSGGNMVCGNKSLYNNDPGPNTGEPFCVDWDSAYPTYIRIWLAESDTSSHTVQISSASAIYSQLSEVYIPNSIQRAITGTSGDFVVIGEDGKPTTKSLLRAEEVEF